MTHDRFPRLVPGSASDLAPDENHAGSRPQLSVPESRKPETGGPETRAPAGPVPFGFEVGTCGPRRSPRDCGRLPFLIQRDGTWLYGGTPIRRKPMVCLFASVLRRDALGRYRLETPAERGEIEVEDVPFVAVELEWRGCGREQVLAFRTNVDQIVCAGPDNPLHIDWDCVRAGGDCAAIPYITVRPGDGAHPIQARIARAVYYELAALAVEGRRHGEPCLGVWSQNRFFPIGPLVGAACETMKQAPDALHDGKR